MLNLQNDIFLNSVGDLINATSHNNEHTILIVDDEINNIQLLKRTLRGKYHIMTASNGLEGLETLKSNIEDISLIVSDHKMPIMEGTKFLEEANKIAPDVIKILLTGFSDIEIITDAVNKCNLFQYILKPFNPEELQEAIKNGLDKFDLMSSKSLILKSIVSNLFICSTTLSKSTFLVSSSRSKYSLNACLKFFLNDLITPGAI